jgi:hypothetical protein
MNEGAILLAVTFAVFVAMFACWWYTDDDWRD